MVITIMNCHVANRGDEAAVHALVDEILNFDSNCKIYLMLRGDTKYPNMPKQVEMIKQFVPCNIKSFIAFYTALITHGMIKLSSSGKRTFKAMLKADIIVHAPGGPSIGDTYYDEEPTYLRMYDLAKAMHKPYMFYAPSMGPFNRIDRNAWRKKVIESAEIVTLRDPISTNYVRELCDGIQIEQTLDSAFQHDIDFCENEKKLDDYKELKNFLDGHNKCIGITITDLEWHPIYSKDNYLKLNVKVAFEQFFDELTINGYGIVFIPQLYGSGNDSDLMRLFCKNSKDFFVVSADNEKYDAYFQQYIIEQLYAVVGMRYHSNIFSAKAGTPFISVSYEQKMLGFMEKMNLQKYCISVENLSCEELEKKFDILSKDYEEYKDYLIKMHKQMKKESYRTTDILRKIINNMRLRDE